MTLLETARTLAALANRDVLEAQPLSLESRNAVARVSLDGGDRAILKFYNPDSDPHAANRFRREEKVLTLLSGAEPPVAPRPLAGFLPAHGTALLLMEDAGEESLAHALTDGRRDWKEVVEFLARLHVAMVRMEGPLRATAMAVELDRITPQTITRRFQIAHSRILGREPAPALIAEWSGFIALLLATPAAMIHNSMSPLNVVSGPEGLRAIDWETLTWASPLWDWAELLRAPYAPMSFDEAAAIVSEQYPAHDTIEVYGRAVFSRHLDSLATVTLRRRGCMDAGQVAVAAEYARRAAFYADEVEMLMAGSDMTPPLRSTVSEMLTVARR